MNEAKRKQCYELFFLVKGHLKYFSDEDLEKFYLDYTKRLWYNEEAFLYYDGFEEAYKKFMRGSESGLTSRPIYEGRTR